MNRTVFIICAFVAISSSAEAESLRHSLTLYGGELTSNHWEEFFNPFDELDFQGTYLLAAAIAREIANVDDKIRFELEGQVVKHFDEQHHWEFNVLGVLRWEPFPWDRYVDTSAAFGIGPSYATEKPPTEIKNEGDTERLLVYWMMELAFSRPGEPRWALVTRIHHRSEAYGLVADNGGSNTLGIGLKYRF